MQLSIRTTTTPSLSYSECGVMVAITHGGYSLITAQKQPCSLGFYTLQCLEFMESGAINKQNLVNDISVNERSEDNGQTRSTLQEGHEYESNISVQQWCRERLL